MHTYPPVIQRGNWSFPIYRWISHTNLHLLWISPMITGGKCPLFFQCWVQTHHGPPWQFQDGPLSTRSAVLAGDRSGSCAREEELRKKCHSTSCVQSCAYIFREFQIRTHIRYISLSLSCTWNIFSRLKRPHHEAGTESVRGLYLSPMNYC